MLGHDSDSVLDRARFVVLTPDEIDDALLDEMLQVLERSFDGWQAGSLSEGIAPRDHLRWRIEGPPGRPSATTTVEVDGRLAGLSITMQRRFRALGESLRVSDSVDSCIDPEFQGHGLMGRRQSLIRERFGSRFDLGMGYTVNAAMQHVDRRYGRRQLGNPLRILVRVRRPWALATETAASRPERMRRFAAFSALQCWGRLRAVRRPGHGARSWSLVTVSDFDHRFEAFMDLVSARFDLIQVRDRDYLHWRYADPRSGSFEIRLAQSGDELLGYSVLKILGRRAFLADLLALPDRLDVAHDLVADALDRCEKAEVAGITCWLPQRHPYAPLLRAAGFVDSRRSTGPALDPRGETDWEHLIPLLQPDVRVHLMVGDSDWI